MILLKNIHLLLLLAVGTFFVLMYIKLYINIKSIRYTLKGMFYFVLFAISFPFSLSNEIYSKREALVRKIYSEKALNNEQKKNIKRLVNSRIRLYFTFTIDHLLHFPVFIEGFSSAYKRWFNEGKHTKNKNNNPLEQLKEIFFGKFPQISNSLKEKFS